MFAVILEADRAVFNLELLDIGEHRCVVGHRRVEEIDEHELRTLERCRELRRPSELDLEAIRSERKREHHQVGLESDVVELDDTPPKLIVERAYRDRSLENRRRYPHDDTPCELFRGRRVEQHEQNYQAAERDQDPLGVTSALHGSQDAIVDREAPERQLFGRLGDEPRAAVPGEVAPRPLDENDDPVVEKRLEQMEVAAIDEGDANRGSSERLRGIEAAKTAADDDDVWQQRQLSSKGIASSSSMMGMSSRIG